MKNIVKTQTNQSTINFSTSGRFLVHMTKRSIVLLTCVLAYASPSFANPNLLLNGSFEKPGVPPGSFTIFPANSTAIPGWTVVGPGNNVFIGSTTLCDPGVCYPAQDLKQAVDLTGAGSNAIEGVQQTVQNTIPGDFYQLSYWVGNVSIGGVFGASSTVTVNINGAPLTSDTNSMSSPVSGGVSLLVWQQFIHVFQATLPATTITFLNGDPSADGINYLDNVVLLHQCCPR